MIGHLRGTPLQVAPGRVLLDVGGVGYAVQIPLSTFYELQKQEEGAEVALFVHTHVRETELALFGFWTAGELELFELLITISGIGPKLAQTALSGMSPEDLAAAVAAGDARRLSSIPGVGKKTAERMIVELRDKVPKIAAIQAADTPATTTPSARGDLVTALVNLGYKAPAAERAVDKITREAPDLDFAELLRRSLKLLSRA